MPFSRRIVIAIGGNAIIAEHERGTWAEQQANAAAIAIELATLKADGHEIVLTHGNGPHVGALHTQHAHARADVPALPFDALVAMTQGQLGYLFDIQDYEHPNSRVDYSKRRHDGQNQFVVHLSHAFTAMISADIAYLGVFNHSNIDDFEYDRQIIQANVWLQF